MTFEPPKRPNAHRRRWSDRVSVGPLLRETWSTIAHGHSRTDHLIELARPHTILLIVATILFGLVSTSCAGVHSHFALPELAPEEPSFLPTVEAYTSAAHGGNTASLLLNGDQIFPAQLDAIRAARQTISYAQYFYEEGSIGQEIAEALAERCRAGIRAHILLDGFGTVLIPTAYQETMRQAGCKVATFRPLSPLSLLAAVGLRRDNKRNHRRILVVDGRIGFTGGSGISPKWMGDGRTEGQWRDTDVRMEGPIVASLIG